MNASECYPDIFPAESPCYGLAEAGLADSRRAVQTEDRGFHVALELQHRKVFDYPLLDRLQSEMVLIQHLLGMFQVQVVLRHLSPWQVQHELDVVELYAVFRRARVVPFQLGHLLFEDFLYGFRPYLFLRLCPEPLKILHLVHSEFFLDGPELAVQIVFPLLLVDFRLDLLVDVLLDFQQFNLRVKHGKQFHCPFLQVPVLKKLHLVHEVLHFQGRAYEVYQEFEIVDGPEGSGCLPRHVA